MIKEVEEKKIEDNEDDKSVGVEPAEISDRESQEKEEKEPPKDIRGAIKHAIKEAEEKENKEEKEDDGEDKKVQGKSDDEKSRDKLVRRVRDSKTDTDNKEEKQEESDKESRQPLKSKHEPIGYWKNKGKSVWDKLTDEDRQHILAREKEVSDGFAQVSQRLQTVSELEQVIAPRRQYIQQFGVTEAQTVDRLFQWMEALSHPNKAYKLNSFKDLARSFGVDVNQLISQQSEVGNNKSQSEGNNESEVVDDDSPPPWFSEFASSVGNEVNSLKQTIATQRQTAANAAVDGWANAKDEKGSLLRPHFNQVRQLMGQLCTPIVNQQTGQVIQEAVIPLKEGRIDLDAAYDAAIKLHPEVAAQVQQEIAQKTQDEAKAKAQKDAKDRADKLARAKRAGAGLKPAAPSMGATLNGKASNSKGTSVRDSIKAALDDLRE